MTYSFKQLSNTDLNHFKQLLKVFGEAFQDVETYQRSVPDDQYLVSLLGKSNFIVLAALYENEVVGGLVAYELEKFEQKRKEIYIYDLAVIELHRRKGLATQLIKNLKQIAKERGAYIIFVQADHGDMPAIKLYKSLGTKEDVYHFDIPVE
ncbi:MAG: Gentamicin 3'-N-acetyltransferase [Parcubacteria group bacterium Gr01-1014_13]|nr:MAG: Gentamicin 3'-N-acetyltransferase [Parcubacteria group bacterium Gr01-1014_13]